MQYHKRRWWCAALLVLCLFPINPAQRRVAPPPSAVPEPPSSEAALRATIDRLYAAYASKDLASLVALWSDKAPDLEAYKQAALRMFKSEHHLFSKPSISSVKVVGLRASLRVTIDRKTVEAQTKRESTERLIRNYAFVKERGRWKIWRESSATPDFAEALVAATPPERQRLLLSETELVSVALRRALVGEGNALYVEGQYQEALGVYRLAHTVAVQIKDREGIAVTLLNIGSAYFEQGSYERALENYQQALTLFEELKAGTDTAATLYAIALVYKEQGRTAQALELLQRALRQSEEVGDKAGMMRTLEVLGSVNYAQGERRLAAQLFEKSLALRAELEDGDEGLAGALVAVGNAYYEQGGYAQALDYYQKALTKFEEAEDEVSISSTLVNVGNVYYSQGNYRSALESYQKSLALAERAGDQKGYAYILLRIGDVFRSQNNYGLALQNYQKGMALNEELGNQPNIATAQGNLGIVYAALADYAQALERYQVSLAISERLGNRAEVARQFSNIGSAQYGMGRYEAALVSFQKSLTIREALNDRVGVARTLGQIGATHYAQGNLAQALDVYQKSLAGKEEVGNKARIVGALLDLAQVFIAQHNYPQALSLSERAAALATSLDSPELLWYAQYRIGEAHRLLKHSEQSRASFEEAIKTLETMRSQVAWDHQSFSQDMSAPYLALVGLLLSENRTSEAFAYAERASALSLLGVVRGGGATVSKGLSTQEIERERKLTDELISLGSQINIEKQRKEPDEALLSNLSARQRQTQADLEAFLLKLYSAHPELKVQRGEVRPATSEEGFALLPETTSALLRYVVAEDQTYLFILTKEQERREGARVAAGTEAEKKENLAASLEGTLKVYRLDITRRELAARAAAFRQQLAQPNGQFQPAARELYNSLLLPAAAQLEGKGSLIIVPDAPLWDVPFEALQRTENRYLLEDYVISYAPSITALRELSKLSSGSSAPKRRASSPTLLALGSPALNKAELERIKLADTTEGLAPAPEAVKEVTAIGQLYGTAQSKIYTGAEATEERVKTESQGFGAVHIAAWGVLDDASPLYSFAALAPGRSAQVREDGLLELRELMSLSLQADVVVWSGMRMARRRAGEGVSALTWATFVAGTPANMVSRWPVRSPATTALMLEFHRHLRSVAQVSRVPGAKARARQQAALKLIRSSEYRHPFYWAGFMVIGW